ncbi:MAG: hypothetical protein QGI83_24480 [Candidatus Latescibacteria bacterium]|nr:hypothetical protein [Candidatus Latescibacterota bacterium]
MIGSVTDRVIRSCGSAVLVTHEPRKPKK